MNNKAKDLLVSVTFLAIGIGLLAIVFGTSL